MPTRWTAPPADETSLLAWLDGLRDTAPVQRAPEGGWHVFGHPEAMEVLGNPAAFSSELPHELPPGSAFQLFRAGNLSWMDPPRHRDLRGLVGKVFTPRYVARLTPMVTEVVKHYLAEVRGRPRFEFVDDYASPIVATVVAKMIGIPPSGQELFRNWSADLMALIDSGATGNALQRATERARLMSVYLHEYLARRRLRPGEDLVSALAQAEIDRQRLDDDEIVGLVALLLSTGQAATLTLVNAMICLDEHPHVADEVRGDPARLRPVVEEVMRFRNQTTRVVRHAREGAELAGERLGHQEQVTVWLAAANRDRRVFADPDRFDSDRASNPHLSLGHGIHFCLGAALARLEIDLALQQLLQAADHVSVDREASRMLDPRLIFGASVLEVEVTWR